MLSRGGLHSNEAVTNAGIRRSKIGHTGQETSSMANTNNCLVGLTPFQIMGQLARVYVKLLGETITEKLESIRVCGALVPGH